MIHCMAKRRFRISYDGVTTEEVPVGTDLMVPADLYPGLARAGYVVAVEPPEPRDLVAPSRLDTLDRPALRTRYQAATGRRPFNGWSADELRCRIAEAEATG